MHILSIVVTINALSPSIRCPCPDSVQTYSPQLECCLCSDLHAIPPPEGQHSNKDAPARTAWNHNRPQHWHCEYQWSWSWGVSGWSWEVLKGSLGSSWGLWSNTDGWCCCRHLLARAVCPPAGKRALLDPVLVSAGHSFSFVNSLNFIHAKKFNNYCRLCLNFILVVF